MATSTPRWLVRAEGQGRLSIRGIGPGSSWQRRYYVQKERLALPFGRKLPPLLEDLVDLALTVYAADRLVRRQQPGEARNRWCWHRQFELHVPVSNPERWTQPEVLRLLGEALGFFTEDQWVFEFHRRPQPRPAWAVQGTLFPPEPPVKAALFSGGLDSLAGLVSQLAEGVSTFAVLTCATNARLLRKQRDLLETLHGRYATRLVPVVLPLRLRQHRRAYNQNERSQRSRGFVFGALGAVAALMAGAQDLAVYENGIGSINLPLSAAQLGSQSTRATHPVALWKLERFMRALLGEGFRFRLPFLFSTKGQMCRRLQRSPFAELALQTVSCDGFPCRLRGPEHCGTCTSCLLRRQALWSSGFTEDRQNGRYRHDVLHNPESNPYEKLAPLQDMLAQVEKLETALGSPDPWADLTVEYPQLLEVRELLTEWYAPGSATDVKQQLLNLYQNYCGEWQHLPARPVGWALSA